MSLLHQVQGYLQDQYFIEPKQRILLAVSGGIDSMVMADMMTLLNYDCGIAHCNFQLRGEASDADHQLVEQLAREKQIPFYVTRFNTSEYASENGISIQMAARELRYNWFSELCNAHHFDKLAIAHNADDQIETFFLNLIRGTGLAGLTGMTNSSPSLIRPLLRISRHQIDEYAQAHQITYREDASNASTKYARNKLRHDIIPQFKTINAQFSERMEANMDYLLLANNFVMEQMTEIKNKITTQDGPQFLIDISLLKAQKSEALCLYFLLEPFGFKGSLIQQIMKSSDSLSGTSYFSKTHQLIHDRNHWIICPLANEQEPFYLNENESFKGFNVQIKTSCTILPSPNIAYLDADLLQFPLQVRHWQAGDRFIPLGMKGEKKISDFLIDRKISLFQKQKQLVVLSGEQIVWLVGQRIDDRYKIKPSTTRWAVITQLIRD